MALIFIESDTPGKSHPPTRDDWWAGVLLVVLLAILFVVLPLLISEAPAQTLGPRVDKATFQAEGVSFWPYELDGNLATAEWLGYTIDPGTQQVIFRAAQLQGGDLCVGPPFNPARIFVDTMGVDELTFVGLFQQNGRYQFVFQGFRFYQVMAIAVPTCGGGR